MDMVNIQLASYHESLHQLLSVVFQLCWSYKLCMVKSEFWNKINREAKKHFVKNLGNTYMMMFHTW